MKWAPKPYYVPRKRWALFPYRCDNCRMTFWLQAYIAIRRGGYDGYTDRYCSIQCRPWPTDMAVLLYRHRDAHWGATVPDLWEDDAWRVRR